LKAKKEITLLSFPEPLNLYLLFSHSLSFYL